MKNIGLYAQDACVCIIVSMGVLFLSNEIASNFFDSLMQSILEVICGIFAINIASTALIAELINKISVKTGKIFDKSKSTLKFELKIQALLILLLLIFMIFYFIDYDNGNIPAYIFSYKEKIAYISRIGILSIFIYFIWLTYDLGRALFAVLNGNNH